MKENYVENVTLRHVTSRHVNAIKLLFFVTVWNFTLKVLASFFHPSLIFWMQGRSLMVHPQTSLAIDICGSPNVRVNSSWPYPQILDLPEHSCGVKNIVCDIKSSWFKLVSTRRSTVLSLPFSKGSLLLRLLLFLQQTERASFFPEQTLAFRILFMQLLSVNLAK
jgi:hypothetical protein